MAPPGDCFTSRQHFLYFLPLPHGHLSFRPTGTDLQFQVEGVREELWGGALKGWERGCSESSWPKASNATIAVRWSGSASDSRWMR